MVEEDIEFNTFDGDVITKSELREELINRYIDANMEGLTKVTDFTIGSEAYHIADVMASYRLEAIEENDLCYRMSMIHTAEGEFLDNMGDIRGVHRIGSSPSVGEVTFTRLNTSDNSVITIPDGSQVATDDAISFIVDNEGEDLVIDENSNTITAQVICEQEGAYTNVLANTVVLVMGDLGNLVSCTNENDFTEGTDIESDDDYRNRILLAPAEFPAGTLGWFENVALTLASVHDVYVEKGVTQLDADVNIYYNPVDWTDTVVNQRGETVLRAYDDLESLFSMKEYDVVGVKTEYILATQETVLENTSSIKYYFGVVLEQNYTIGMVKDDIEDKIEQFNSDANIGIEFNPSSLASIIENEVEGVNICKIVKKENNTYTEIIEPVSMNKDEVYQIDTSELDDNIKVINFNLSIEVE